MFVHDMQKRLDNIYNIYANSEQTGKYMGARDIVLGGIFKVKIYLISQSNLTVSRCLLQVIPLFLS